MPKSPKIVCSLSSLNLFSTFRLRRFPEDFFLEGGGGGADFEIKDGGLEIDDTILFLRYDHLQLILIYPDKNKTVLEVLNATQSKTTFIVTMYFQLVGYAITFFRFCKFTLAIFTKLSSLKPNNSNTKKK